jgi:hypothetical protein
MRSDQLIEEFKLHLRQAYERARDDIPLVLSAKGGGADVVNRRLKKDKSPLCIVDTADGHFDIYFQYNHHRGLFSSSISYKKPHNRGFEGSVRSQLRSLLDRDEKLFINEKHHPPAIFSRKKPR